jgi:hypothetical protein
MAAAAITDINHALGDCSDSLLTDEEPKTKRPLLLQIIMILSDPATRTRGDLDDIFALLELVIALKGPNYQVIIVMPHENFCDEENQKFIADLKIIKPNLEVYEQDNVCHFDHVDKLFMMSPILSEKFDGELSRATIDNVITQGNSSGYNLQETSNYFLYKEKKFTSARHFNPETAIMYTTGVTKLFCQLSGTKMPSRISNFAILKCLCLMLPSLKFAAGLLVKKSDSPEHGGSGSTIEMLKLLGISEDTPISEEVMVLLNHYKDDLLKEKGLVGNEEFTRLLDIALGYVGRAIVSVIKDPKSITNPSGKLHTLNTVDFSLVEYLEEAPSFTISPFLYDFVMVLLHLHYPTSITTDQQLIIIKTEEFQDRLHKRFHELNTFLNDRKLYS